MRRFHYVQDTPTLDTSAYTAGDRLGSIQGVNAGHDGKNCVLQSLNVLDKDDQGNEIDIYFFSQQPTVASDDNAAIDVADAQMEYCTARVTVASGDYDDMSGNKFASKQDLKVPLRCDDNGKFWYVMVTRGTPTHTASGLVLSFHVEHTL